MDQTNFASSIKNNIDKNGVFLFESMENVVIENKFLFSTTIDKKTYTNNSKIQKK